MSMFCNEFVIRREIDSLCLSIGQQYPFEDPDGLVDVELAVHRGGLKRRG